LVLCRVILLEEGFSKFRTHCLGARMVQPVDTPGPVRGIIEEGLEYRQDALPSAWTAAIPGFQWRYIHSQDTGKLICRQIRWLAAGVVDVDGEGVFAEPGLEVEGAVALIFGDLQIPSAVHPPPLGNGAVLASAFYHHQLWKGKVLQFAGEGPLDQVQPAAAEKRKFAGSIRLFIRIGIVGEMPDRLFPMARNHTLSTGWAAAHTIPTAGNVEDFHHLVVAVNGEGDQDL